MANLRPYTVVLLRPEWMHDFTETTHGQDIYVALVDALDEYHAIKVAKAEVVTADKKDEIVNPEGGPPTMEDYKLCVMFEGKHPAKLWGWQVH